MKEAMAKRPSRNQVVRSYLDYAYSFDYKERPPSMDEFLNSPTYLGNLTNGGKTIYPIWQKTLKVIAKEDSKYMIVLTGAIGTGKSSTALFGILYGMCRILCLKDPWAKFGLARGAQMSVVFFNLTKSQSESLGYKSFQSYLVQSPWFREHGIVGGSELSPRVDFPLFKYTFASPFVSGFGVQGENTLFALIDEVDSPVASEIQREKVISAYENARRRLESRFVIKGETLGRFFLVASKQERLSFLNAFVAKYRGSKNVIVVDIPLWEAKPASMYCGQKFSVSIGDIYNPPKILNTEEELQQATRTGYQIIQVPVEYKDDFEKDVVGALRDISGISSSSVRISKLFPSESIISKCYESTPNPVKKLTIEIGLKDDINLLDYIDLSLLRVPRNVPRYIHVDFAFSGDGDACGFAMSCVEGWKKKNVERPDGTFQTARVPAVHTDFAMRIKGKPGDKIPLHLIRKLILDLKGIHRYNVAECTFDLLIATESDKQILERSGIACDHFSVDKNPQYYRDFQNLVAEERWTTPFHPYLHFELKNLEDDPEKNKIDHPKEVVEIEILKDGDAQEVVMVGSKDLCFTKDVKIALLDGRKLTIPDIARELKKGKELYTYSVDLSEQKVVPGRIIAAFKNGRSKELVEITLDNGEKITCTKSHPFITKDGKYIVAQNLKQGMSLLPLYLSFYKGYRLVQNPFTGKNHFEHRLFSGFSDKHLSCNKYLVHHRWNEEKRIFDILDNSPHMLQIMSHGEHSKLHALLATPEKLKKMQLAAQKVMSTLEWKEKQAEVARRAVRTRVERGSGRSWVRELKEKGLDPAKDPRMRKFAEAGGKARKGVSSWNAGLTPEADPRVKKNREKLKLVQLANIQKLKIQGVNHFICPFCEKEFKNTNECFVKYHLVICKRNQEVLTAAVCRFCGKSFSNITRGTFRGHVGSCALWSKKSNHKVVNIRPVEMTSDVYDITVEEHHNFALAAGVFVHNSDATCASVINAIQKSTAPPDVEVMAALLDKVQPKKTGFEDLWWVNSGVEKKKVDKTVPVTDPNTTYLDILKKARSIHRTF